MPDWPEVLNETGTQRPLSPNLRYESAGRWRGEALHGDEAGIMGN
jgi:hypothetical protein